MASRQLVIFGINGEEFGVEITHVKEINRPMEIFKIPNTPDYIEGLINLRGKVHTVFNLRKRFGLADNGMDENSKIIMVNVDTSVIGFIVDEVKEIIRVEDEDLEDTPKVLTDLKGKYVNGVAKIGERVVLMLNLDTTFRIQEDEAV